MFKLLRSMYIYIFFVTITWVGSKCCNPFFKNAFAWYSFAWFIYTFNFCFIRVKKEPVWINLGYQVHIRTIKLINQRISVYNYAMISDSSPYFIKRSFFLCKLIRFFTYLYRWLKEKNILYSKDILYSKNISVSTVWELLLKDVNAFFVS